MIIMVLMLCISKEEFQLEQDDFDRNFLLHSVLGQKRLVNDEILFKLSIPRINLERVVYNMDSGKNHIDYHVQILNGSDLEKKILFLAAHSGTGKASYFNRLVELEIGDFIYIDTSDEKLSYVIEELFYIEKNGYLEYSPLETEKRLYLITCSLKYVNKQLVVKAILID